MFRHRKIQNPDANRVWENTIKKSISSENTRKAAEKIGHMASRDMIDFSGIDKSEIDVLFVKYRDGTPMLKGMKDLFPEAEAVYLKTERYGSNNEKVSIRPLGDYDFSKYRNKIAWFVDPIMARGTTALECLRKIKGEVQSKQFLISNIVSNIKGISNIQALITDFNGQGYLNYAYKSTNLDEENGFLKDGLQRIPDFGDKAFGTLGGDYSIDDLRKREERKWHRQDQVGEIERTKSVILYILQIREKNKLDRDLQWPTLKWIKWATRWLKVYKKFDIRTEDKTLEDTINELVEEEDFLEVRKVPYKSGWAHLHSISEDGVEYSSKVIVPLLANAEWTQEMLKDSNYFLKKSPDELRKSIRKEMD